VLDEVENSISIVTLTDVLRAVVLGDNQPPAPPAYPEVCCPARRAQGPARGLLCVQQPLPPPLRAAAR
jgi:hypothetical protein